MKTLMLFSLVVFACLTTSLAASRSPDQIARGLERRRAALAAKGGLVTKPQNGNVIRIVSSQKAVDIADIRKLISGVDAGLRMGVEVSEIKAGKSPLEDVETALQLPKTGIVLMVVEDQTLPVILSAPENAWAILNVGKLGDDLPPKEVYDRRVRKELCRALASACGVGLSYNKPCVMEPVYSKTALDNLKIDTLGPEAISKMQDAAMARGIKPIKVATYLTACQEGWAPAPTNDVQKAIFDEVRSEKERGPVAGLQIKP